MAEQDPQLTPGTSPGPEWVSAAEAAKAAGLTPATIRSWGRDGLIATETMQGPFGPQKMFRLDEVVRRAASGDRRRGERRRAPEIRMPGDRRKGDRREAASAGPGVPRAGRSVGAGRRATDHAPPPAVDQPSAPVTFQTDVSPGAYLEPIIKTIPDLVQQLAETTDRAARAETKVEFLSQQISELKSRLRQRAASETHEPAVAESEEEDATPEPEPKPKRPRRSRLEEEIWGPESQTSATGSVPSTSPAQTAGPTDVTEATDLPKGWRRPDAEPEPRRRWFRRRGGRHSN